MTIQNSNFLSMIFRLVRLTSPTLNYIIIVGAIVIYSSVYTYFYIPGATKDLMVIECSVSSLHMHAITYFIVVLQ